ncbi:hypothetical protein HDU99_009288 [Rhizoclosmatium hyalinum]|nr:hypothetical protein HDU99_009288 [Rhizoclosmatium hyalinum]
MSDMRLQAKLKWMLAGLIPVDLSFFLNYAGYGNFFLVRMAAIDSLLLLDGFSTDELVNYLAQLVEHDPDPRVQYHIAKELYNVAVLIKNVSAEDPKRKKASTVVSSHSWVTVQAKIVKNNVVGDLIWSLLRKSTLDFRIRSYLLRFCEKVYTPVAFQAAVTPRKLVIKMPSLTMNEASEIPSKPLPKQPAAKPPPAPKPPPKAPVFTEPLPPVDPKFLETGRKVIHNLTNHPSAAAFMLPVDESFAPMYFSLIKKPMDISTAAKKLESGAYRNNLTFLFADIQLIFSNCYKYNTDDSPVTKQAQRLEIYFNTQIMPRALVHELNILSNAIDVEEESHSITPTDMMEDVIASPAIPVPVPQPVSVPVSVPVPVEPKVPAPKPAIKLTYKPAPVDKPKDTPPKLTLLPPKPVAPTTAPQNPVTTTATSAIPSEVRHPQSSNVASPPLKPPTVQPPIPKAVAQPPVPKPAVLAQPPVPKPSSQPPIPKPNVFTQPPVPKSSTPAQPPIPKPSAPKVAQPPIPKPALLPPTVPPPLPKPVLKLKPEESETTAPKRKLSVGGGTVVSPNVPSMPVARLESEDYKKCKKILRHLFENEKSFWFHAPVDPIALGIPTYFEVIKEPMDLATLKTLLAEGKVVTVKEFRHKCGLIFKNAMNFNPPNTQVYQDALFLLEMFRTEMKTYFSGGSDTKAVGAAVSSRPQPVAPAPIDAFKASVQTQEPVIKKLKLKHDKGPEVGQPASFPPKAVPSPMVPIAAPTHSQPSFSSSGSERMLISSVAGKKCQKVLKKLQASNFGAIFLAPVDPVALKIPEYFNVIKRPMDLGTIQKRLEKGQYRDHLAFKADVELVLNNCFTFNVPGDWVYNQGKGLEGVFHKEWKDIDWDIIPIPGQARPVGPTIEKTLEKLRSHPNGFIFLEPVDPTILPDYYTRIRNPIDLRTMGEKLQRGEYQTLDAFEKDIKLMFANCFTYNEKESLGHNSGLALEKYFKSIFVKGK